jgi:hypothetical protein
MYTIVCKQPSSYLIGIISDLSEQNKEGHWPLELVADRWEHQSPIERIRSSVVIGYSYLIRYLNRQLHRQLLDFNNEILICQIYLDLIIFYDYFYSKVDLANNKFLIFS